MDKVEKAFIEYRRECCREWRRKNKDSVNERVRKDRAKNPEKYREYIRKWRKKNPDKALFTTMARNNKLTISYQDYKKMETKQKKLCKVCKKPESKKSANNKKRKLLVDLNSADGKIKGLLCYSCKNIIKHSKDSVKVLEKAISYIKSY